MTNVAVIGAQWGDEGKGKIVDWLSEKLISLSAFRGYNAGHTLVIDGTEYKLSLLPSGIVRPGKFSVIGNGVVIDPAALVREMEILSGQGVAISPENLMISTAAPIILPVHQQVDLAREKRRGAGKIGTTGAVLARLMKTRWRAAACAWLICWIKTPLLKKPPLCLIITMSG